MPKLLLRVVAILLVPCLLIDQAFCCAPSFSKSASAIKIRSDQIQLAYYSHGIFAEQSLANAEVFAPLRSLARDVKEKWSGQIALSRPKKETEPIILRLGMVLPIILNVATIMVVCAIAYQGGFHSAALHLAIGIPFAGLALPISNQKSRLPPLKHPAPLVLLGGGSAEEFLSPLYGFARYGYVKTGQTIKSIVPFHFDAGSSSLLQEDVRVIWAKSGFIKMLNWLDRNSPATADILRQVYRWFGVELVETIPTLGAFMCGFGAGSHKELINRILLYRPTEEVHQAVEVIRMIKNEIRKLDARFDHTQEIQDLFSLLQRYAQVVDQHAGIDISGKYSMARHRRRSWAANVQNILALGVLLEVCKPGRINLKKYYGALNHLAAILNAPSVSIHSSLWNSRQATVVATLQDAELLEMPDGVMALTNRLEGQWALKTVRHSNPVTMVRVVNPRTDKRISPPAPPEAILALQEAEQVVITPKNLQGDLAAYLASTEIAEALVKRRRQGRLTNVVVPISTRDGTPSVINEQVDEALRKGTGYGLSDIATHVLINNLAEEPDAEVKIEAEKWLEREQAEVVTVEPSFMDSLRGKGMAVFQGPLGEMVDAPKGLRTESRTYQIAPNRLAFFLKCQLITQQHHVAPVWISDIDGTLKPSGPRPLPMEERREIGRCLMARAPFGLLTGGSRETVERLNTNAIMGDLKNAGHPEAMRLMPLQTVAGSMTDAYNPATNSYEFVTGELLEDVIGAEKVQKLREIFDETILRFNIGNRNKEMGFEGIDGSGFWGPYWDDRKAGVTFAVIGKDAPDEAIARYNRAGGKNLNREYLDFLIRRCSEEQIPMKWSLGSEFQIDGTLEWIDKGNGLELLSKLTGIPVEAMIFSGDNIRWTQEGMPGNDTKAAQRAGFSLNVDGRLLDEPIPDKTVITPSRKGDDHGLVPYLILYRNYYGVLPESYKDFDRRLDEGIKQEKERRKMTSPEHARIELSHFMRNGYDTPLSEADAGALLDNVRILRDKGNAAGDCLLAYQTLRRMSILTISEPTHRGVEKELRALARQIYRDIFKDYLSMYQRGDLSRATNLEPPETLLPVEHLPTLEGEERTRTLSLGKKTFEEGKVGYILFLGSEPLDKKRFSEHMRAMQKTNMSSNTPIRVLVVTSFQNHAAAIALLKCNAFYGLKPDQIHVEFQGIVQSVGVASQQRHHFWGTGQKHLTTPGTLDAVTVPLMFKTLVEWATKKIGCVIIADSAYPVSNLESDYLLIGRLVEKNAEMVVSLTDRDPTDITASPYYNRSNDRIELRDDFAVKEGARRPLGHAHRDAVSLDALFRRLGADAEDAVSMDQFTWMRKIHNFIHTLRQKPYVVGKVVKEGIRMLELDQFVHPLGNLTYGLATEYLYSPRTIAKRGNIYSLLHMIIPQILQSQKIPSCPSFSRALCVAA